MEKQVAAATLVLASFVAGAPSGAQDLSQQEMRSLDEQVQEIKTDVLDIAAELVRLEERLLYPSNTQVAVFVSLPEGETFRLDAVQINIDGQLATHYIYSFKELEALQNGGMQRIYTGNVPTGDHEIEISVAGMTTGGREFTRTETFAFNKGVEPKLLGIALPNPDTIHFGEW